MEKKEVHLFVNPNTMLGSTYAQIVSVTVNNDGTTTLDFIYKHPRDQNEGQVVTRVTLPTAVAKDLSDVINKTIIKSESKKKNGTKDKNNNK